MEVLERILPAHSDESVLYSKRGSKVWKRNPFPKFFFFSLSVQVKIFYEFSQHPWNFVYNIVHLTVRRMWHPPWLNASWCPGMLSEDTGLCGEVGLTSALTEFLLAIRPWNFRYWWGHIFITFLTLLRCFELPPLLPFVVLPSVSRLLSGMPSGISPLRLFLECVQ